MLRFVRGAVLGVSASAETFRLTPQTGSPYNEPTMFSIPVWTNALSLTKGGDGDVMQIAIFLFNTGDATCLAEKGGFSSSDPYDFQAEPEEVVHEARIDLSASTVLETDVTVRKEHAYTYHRGAGQIGASLSSAFVAAVRGFTIRVVDAESAELITGEKNSSLDWSEIDLVNDEADHWIVAGNIAIGETSAFETSFRMNTGSSIIKLPVDMYDALIASVVATGGTPSSVLNRMFIKDCDSATIPALFLGFREEIPIQRVDIVSEGADERSCLLHVGVSESSFVELGEPFLNGRAVHFDSDLRKVSFADV
jgi:hypothetical protein